MTVDFSNMRLGKQEPADRPALMLRDVLTGTMPATPVSADHFANVPSWELGGNDVHGTCGPTSVANLLRLVTFCLTGTMIAVTLDDVYDLYRRSGNPNFDPNKSDTDPTQQDNGVVMQDMLEALLRGGIGGHKPLAFAKIATDDMDTLDKAIAIFGGVLLGLKLETAQQRQKVWDYTPSSLWGGHAVMAGKFVNPDGTASDRADIITWSTDVAMTRSFVGHQEDEAWVVIWPYHLGTKQFMEGVDQDALAQAYQELTGEPFPAAPAPDPTPTPTPDPTPTPVDPEARQELEDALNRFLRTHEVPKYLRLAANDWLTWLAAQ